jgi:hypothetical protein
LRVETKKGIKTWHRCTRCDYIFLDEALHLTAEDEYKVYQNHQNSITDARYVAYFRRFIDAAIISCMSVSGAKGLDYGSGPSPVLATILARDYGIPMDIYDLYYAPEKIYLNRQYDLITSTEVVEHLADPLACFRLFKSLLNHNGLISIMTLLHPPEDDEFLKWWYIRDPSHRSFYTRSTFEHIGAIVGLEVIYTNNKRYLSLRHV